MGTYLVAGGSKGIGLATVKRLAEQGHELCVVSRTRGDLDAATKHIACDFTESAPASEALPEKLDGLVYCPGSIQLRSFRLLKIEQFLEDFNVNVLGAVRLLKAAMPALQRGAEEAGRPSSVVLFSTVAVAAGMPMHASIATAKGALEGLVRSLAAEWAPKVRVNAIAPALVETDLSARFFATPEKAEAMAARYPLKRAGRPDDIAACASYLLGDGADWVTGQVIGVDGGMSALRS